MPVLIAALALAGVYYGGRAAVHAIKRAEHAVFHKRHKKPQAGLSCAPGEAAGSGYSCLPWVERRFDSLDAAVTYFSQPGKSSTSNPREYLARFLQPDGSVIVRTVP